MTPPPILERESYLDELAAALDRASDGTGSVALVSGEAGIGKTALIDAFAARAREADVRVLCGFCDALRTPRPLGPLLDIARAAGGRLRAISEGEPKRERLFATFLDELQRLGRATVVVVEDVHWADDATLDLLTFLGRRVRDTSALLVATFRDDELAPEHPLREVVTALPRAAILRLRLPRLSEVAVAELARRAGRSAADLFGLTSGNPFYVTEVLAGDRASIPTSVRDAVVARAGHLEEPARRVLDAVSLAPGRLERWLVDSVIGPRPQDVEVCLASGLLVSRGADLAFRHELARQAWEGTVDVGRARDLHGRILAELQVRHGNGLGVARLVHHATGADDRAALLRLAPRAGAEAARLGAHREAAAHYSAALGCADDLDPATRAGLLEALSLESGLTGAMEQADRALEEALDIRRRLGDRRKQSEDLRGLARLAWFRGEEGAVRRHTAASIEAAEPLGTSAELATSYCAWSQLLMSLEENREAVEWGTRALDMARELDEVETAAHSLINVGCALLNMGDTAGREVLEECLRLAREHDLHDPTARVLINQAEIAVDWRDMERAEACLEDGIRFCMERDFDPYVLCGIATRSMLRLWTGDWSGAADDVAIVLGHPRVPAVDRIPALAALGRLRARRGDPGVWEALDEGRDLAAPTAELHRIAPIAAARAEAAWLAGGAADVAGDVRSAYDLALRRDNPWAIGELACWLWRAGDLDAPPENAAPPYALEMRGDPRAAADLWERIGFPFERALALAECGEPAAGRQALRILHRLGARRAAEAIAGELRDRGVSRLPRGPRPTTRRNPAGLTARQLQVLELVAEGLSNGEIAGRLFISPKTVEHHVSAVLAKLGASSRTEAAVRARELDLS